MIIIKFIIAFIFIFLLTFFFVGLGELLTFMRRRSFRKILEEIEEEQKKRSILRERKKK